MSQDSNSNPLPFTDSIASINQTSTPHQTSAKSLLTFNQPDKIISFLGSALGLSALFIIAGFFVIGSYTRKYGEIVIFSVQVGHYLAAGVWGCGVLLLALLLGYTVNRVVNYFTKKWVRTLISHNVHRDRFIRYPFGYITIPK
jgi:hypothetical protein